MNLLIVESSGKIKKLLSFLPEGWQVAASFGHVRDLPRKDMGVGPPDFRPRYVNTERGGQVIKALSGRVKGASEVFLATDPDREGEAIAWHLARTLRIAEPRRVTYTEITERAVKRALESPRPLDMNLVRAQEGRRVLDRLYGYGVSPAVSDAAGQPLSAGRVQSPALRLVVERERQIRAFASVQHYAVDLYFGGRKGAPGTWKAVLNARPLLPPGEEFFRDRAAANILAAVPELTVRSYVSSETRQSPPPPFITSTLQQAAFNALKLDPEAAMACAQKLYEDGHITYMRTDSPALSEEAVSDIRRLAGNRGWPLPPKPRIFKGREGAQEAHEAIRPVHAGLEEAGDTPDERALYRLIRLRALASQLADATYQAVRATLVAPVTLPPYHAPAPAKAGGPAPAGGLLSGLGGAAAGPPADAGPALAGTAGSPAQGSRSAVHASAGPGPAGHASPGPGPAAPASPGHASPGPGPAGSAAPAAGGTAAPVTPGAGPRQVTAVFEAKGRRLTAPGWRTLTPRDQAQDEKEDPELDNPVPALKEGASVSPAQGEVRTRRTQAPARYTQAALIRELERRGIGRPSTYASIMGNIAARGYVSENRRRQLEATATGEELVGLMEGSFGFLEYGFTRNLEERLDGIACGQAEYLPVVSDAYGILQRELAGFRRSLPERGGHPPCPACGEALSHMARPDGPGGRGWNYWRCRNPDCGSSYDDRDGAPDPATRRRSLQTDFTCPDCGSPMRHLTREGSRQSGGYNFWRCSKDDCMTTIDDRDGKPDYPSQPGADRDDIICPECGAPVRRVTRPAAAGPRSAFWKCSSDTCGSAWNERDGAPDWPTRRISALTDELCPVCEGRLRHYRKDPFPGSPGSYDYWGCQDRACRSFFPDLEGQPDLETRYSAPPVSGKFCHLCGEPVRHVARRAEGGRRAESYWQCQGADCGVSCPDLNGSPDTSRTWTTRLTDAECPLCSSPLSVTTFDRGPDAPKTSAWSCSSPACPGRWPDSGGSPDFDSQPGSAAADPEEGQGGPADSPAAWDAGPGGPAPGQPSRGNGAAHGAYGEDAGAYRPGETDAYGDGTPDDEARGHGRKCPACGGDLRHMVRNGGGADGYNYWKCGNVLDCGSSFDDRDGHPDPSTRRVSVVTDRTCPECGSRLRHNMKEDVQDGKPGWNFWACSGQGCFKRFNDSDGEPDFESPFLGVPDPGHVCPRCQGPIRHVHREGADASQSYNYWKCLDSKHCGASYDDLDGAPDASTLRRILESPYTCPSCGRPLRHSMKEASPDGSTGWDFWSCTDRNCGIRYNDLNGAPDFESQYVGGAAADPDHVCPACGGQIRHLLRRGPDAQSSWNYWRCADKSCGSTFDDLDGAPDPSTRRVSLETLETCPNCGENLRRHSREPREDGTGGYAFWACPSRSCRARFNDLDGAPDFEGRGGTRDQTDVPCPECSTMLRHLVREGPSPSDSYNYWKCPNAECGSNFSDLDGAPDPSTRRVTLDSEYECESCGTKLRHHVKAPGPDGTGGYDFWGCPNRDCRVRYADGGGGPDFAAGPQASSLGQTDVPCPACGTHLRHLEKKGATPQDSWNYWRCPDLACGSSYDDLDGAPDPSSRRVSTVSAEHVCPMCGKPLRHSVKAAGTAPDGTEIRGWNFWACTDRACNSMFNDLDGAPDLEGGPGTPRDLTDVPCPACGSFLRHLERTGATPQDSWNYWKCPDQACGSSYDDLGGAPDPSTRRVTTVSAEHVCPSCGRPLRHSVRDAGTAPDGTEIRGWNFWACTDRACNSMFNDLDGAPDLAGGPGSRSQTDVPCPACGTHLRHLEKAGATPQDSYNYWKCPDQACGSSYDDLDGAPDPSTRRVSTVSDEHFCPRCGKPLRHSVKAAGTAPDGTEVRGWNLWSCTDRACNSMFNDLDGAPDLEGGPGTPRDLTDVPCPHCQGMLRHLVSDGSGGRDTWNYWKCPNPECGSAFDDLDGAPDPATHRRTVESEHVCPSCGSRMRRHVKQPDIEGNGGWDFWACSSRTCRTRYGTRDGAPDWDSPWGGESDVACPACSAPLRHMVRTGTPSESYNYWRCTSESCGSSFEDLDGAPDPSTRKVSVLSEHVCPTCGSFLRHVTRAESGSRRGMDLWSCSSRNCRTFFDDKDGAPDFSSARRPAEPSGIPCPECGKDLVHMQRDASGGREGYNYWKCPDDGCGAFFDDSEGRPDPSSLRKTLKTSRPCGKCGSPLLHKIRSAGPGGRGWNFWSCSNRDCQAAYEDANGAPGPERVRTTAALSEHVCEDCGRPLRHIVKEGDNGYNFWGCSGFPACKATYTDADGRPGPKQPPRSEPSGFKCVRCGSDLFRRKGTSRSSGMDYDFFSCSNQKCRAIYNVKDNAPDVPEAVLKRLAASLKSK
ncbi:MAG: hypothetical protein LBT40_09860 [Deltaproteobacteria bacterium]|jgi:DNA topoisomerase IA/ssDNA-binding Zn-finger/Zn-ribbon topoisomerase 1|nr:hypothetical protein [Deltaproteobacteria bacterium]